MNLRHLGYLVALAQERKFHKAARCLPYHPAHLVVGAPPARGRARRAACASTKAPAKVRRRAPAASGSCVSGKRDDA